MITVSGHSDDLICVDGDIAEEFSILGDDDSYLAFSDGTVLSIRFADEDDGVWRITPSVRGAGLREIAQWCSGDDGYSDLAVLDGIRWVVYGSRLVTILAASPSNFSPVGADGEVSG